MELSGFVQEQAVITGSCPVTITVDHGHVECQKLQNSINVQHGGQFSFESVQRSFVQCLAQEYEGVPCLLSITGLHFVTPLIFVQVVTEISQASISIGTAADLPARSLCRFKVFREKIFIELLDVHIDAPAFSINHDMDMVGFRGRYVLICDMGIEHRTQK